MRCGGQPSVSGASSPFATRCRVLREIDALHSISSSLAVGGDFGVAMGELFAKLQQVAGLEFGLLCILDREREDLVVDAADGIAAEGWRSVVVKPGEGRLGAVAEFGETLLVDDISTLNPARLSALDRLQCRDGAGKAWLAAPIKHGTEVLGALSFRCATAAPDVLEAELRFLVLIAGQVGLAVRFRQMAKERFDSLQRENERLQEQLAHHLMPPGMIGKSSGMRMVYFHVDQVADSKTTVLIRGETGVGKERIALAIWESGTRRPKPFVRVNCAALPESIIESELFGHEKGAFTGAFALRKGRFEMAHTGTIFLDELGEISLATQAKLLRVLQEGTFERVGGSETIKVDVRVICATNCNLEEMIDAGKWRLDLYYRINVFPIYVPPLRERRSDTLELADYFLEKYARQNGKRMVRISTPAIDTLMAYHWPGNVRELENVIERAVLLSQDGVVHSYHLPPTLQTAQTSHTEARGTLQESLDAVEREMINEALKNHRGFMARAARELGLTERMMGLRAKKYGIDTRRFRNAGES